MGCERARRWLLRAAAVLLISVAGLVVPALPGGGRALAAPSRASVTDEFSAGKSAFQYGDYKSAIRILHGLLYPTPQIPDEVRLIEAYRLLGISYFFEGNRDAARREFAAVITLRPDYRMDPLVVPPPVVVFFEGVRKSMAKELERLRELERAREERRRREAERRKREEEERRKVYIERRVIESRRTFFPSLLPFGAGQFNNGQLGKGIAFLSTEVALVATSVGLYFAAESYRGPDGLVTRGADASAVRRLQIAQVTVGGLALGVMAWGIVDAIVNYRPVIGRREELKPLPRPAAGTRRLSLSPLLHHGGGGLSLGGRF